MSKRTEEIAMRIAIAYTMCDAVNSELLKLIPLLKEEGQDLHRDEKRKFKDLYNAAITLKVRSKDVEGIIYDVDGADGLCDSSDFIQDSVELLFDRLGYKQTKRDDFLGGLRNMKSELNIIE